MYHTIGWFAAIGQTANTDIAPIVDDVMQIQNSHFVIPKRLDLLAAYVGSATLSRARLNSGTIRQINPTYIRPTNATLLPANKPNISSNLGYPLGLNGPEELILEATSALACGTENLHAIALIRSRNIPVPAGDRYRVRFTSTTTSVIHVWTTIALTFETGLPVGNYAVVGCELQSTNGVAFRLIFDNQWERPGWLKAATLGLDMRLQQFEDELGTWGVFNTVSLPRVQVLDNVANASHEGYLELVRTNLSPIGISLP